MKVILITQPCFFDGEASIINRMFEAGLELLHLRKPNATATEMEKFLSAIADEYKGRVVLHGHFHLVAKYNLRGAHLGANRQLDICDFVGQISYSCHSIAEVACKKNQHSYVFLSPVFDSISKQGYASAFTDFELLDAHHKGIIDDKVIALGGVTLDVLPYVNSWGFGGIALLGDIWQRPDPVARLCEYLQSV